MIRLRLAKVVSNQSFHSSTGKNAPPQGAQQTYRLPPSNPMHNDKTCTYCKINDHICPDRRNEKRDKLRTQQPNNPNYNQHSGQDSRQSYHYLHNIRKTTDHSVKTIKTFSCVLTVPQDFGHTASSQSIQETHHQYRCDHTHYLNAITSSYKRKFRSF